MKPVVDRYHYYRKGTIRQQNTQGNLLQPQNQILDQKGPMASCNPSQDIKSHNDFSAPDTSFGQNLIKTEMESKPEPSGTKLLSNKEKKRANNPMKLRGSQRKRFKFWLKNGKSFKEAIELAPQRLWMVPEYKILKEEKKRLKKERSKERKKQAKALGISPSEMLVLEKKIKVSGHDTPLVTVANASGPMTDAQMESVRDEILKTIESSTRGTGPNFVGCSVTDGNLVLTCSNVLTKEWLIENISGIKPFDGAMLRIIENPKFKIGDIWVQDPDLNEESLLRRLDSQNIGLNFREWRILERKIYSHGQQVKFAIDEVTHHVLSKRQFKLFLNFGTVTVKVLPPEYLKVLDISKEGLYGPFGKPKIITVPTAKDRRQQQQILEESSESDSESSGSSDNSMPNPRGNPPARGNGSRGGNMGGGRGGNMGGGRGENMGRGSNHWGGGGRGSNHWGGGGRGSNHWGGGGWGKSKGNGKGCP